MVVCGRTSVAMLADSKAKQTPVQPVAKFCCVNGLRETCFSSGISLKQGWSVPNHDAGVYTVQTVQTVQTVRIC